MTSLPGDLDVSLDQLEQALDNLDSNPMFGVTSGRPEDFFVGEIDATEAPRPHLDTSQSSNALFSLTGNLNTTRGTFTQGTHPPELLLGTSAPAALPGGNWPRFPAIPEHAELQLAQNPTTAAAFPTEHPTAGTFIPTSTVDFDASLTLVEREGAATATLLPTLGSGLSAGVPRVASMPNLPLAGMTMGVATTHTNATIAHQHTGGAVPGLPSRQQPSTSLSRGIPRSLSADDVTNIGTRYTVPHSEFLTPPHLRKGKGGRQPAIDPRLDPRIDPKKAKRILANRLSAAKSKLKQKSATEGMRHRVEMLRLQREGLALEVNSLAEACAAKEAERETLKQQLRAAEESLMAGKTTLIPIAPSVTVVNGAGQLQEYRFA